MKEISDSLPPTFTTATARAHGVHPRDLYAWRNAEQIVELRGVFRHAEAPLASYPDALAVAFRAPRDRVLRVRCRGARADRRVPRVWASD